MTWKCPNCQTEYIEAQECDWCPDVVARRAPMSEVEIQRRIMLGLSSAGARVFRNNVGQLQARDGSIVRYGLCVGSSDLIGWNTITITPEMVGRKVAVFTAIEVKAARGKLTGPQEIFLNAVRSAGGIATVARDVDQAIEALKRF